MDKKSKVILSVATVAVLALLITAFFVRGGQQKAPDFTPPPFEVNAQSGELQNTDAFFGKFDLPYEDGNKCTVGLEAVPIVTEDEIFVNFTSFKGNTVWVRLVVLDENKDIVCESGVLKPGEYVEALKLNKSVADEKELSAKILTFEPKTYYSLGSAGATLKLK